MAFDVQWFSIRHVFVTDNLLLTGLDSDFIESAS